MRFGTFAAVLLAAGARGGEPSAGGSNADLLAELLAAKAELEQYKAELAAADKTVPPTPGNAGNADVQPVPTREGELDVAAFVRDVEDLGMDGADAWAKHLSGRGKDELLRAARDSVHSQAPAAAALALTADAVCASEANDRQVMDLLKMHLESCPHNTNAFRGAVHTAILHGMDKVHAHRGSPTLQLLHSVRREREGE